MSTRNPDARYETAAQAVPRAIHQHLKHNVHTSFPGTIVSYNATTKRARVQPSIDVLLADGSTMARAVILNVPVRQLATGGWLVHHQIDDGDVVLCIVSERTLDGFKQNWGQRSAPAPEVLFDARTRWRSRGASKILRRFRRRGTSSRIARALGTLGCTTTALTWWWAR